VTGGAGPSARTQRPPLNRYSTPCTSAAPRTPSLNESGRRGHTSPMARGTPAVRGTAAPAGAAAAGAGPAGAAAGVAGPERAGSGR
jgi:hypothetical protein